jgi:protein-S-isoprenylcysteine O-methyltransferase Ste14
MRMGATRIEFRLRMAIMAVLITLGYWAPWIKGWGIGTRMPLMMGLAIELSRLGLLSFAVATRLMMILAALIAAKGMVFRLWGSAYLEPATVLHGQMKAGTLIVGGPYRHVRNPLYIGLWSMTAAMAFLMPLTGAILILIAVPLFLLRLTLGEEAFLTGELGAPYQDYLRAVPRLVPRLRSSLPPTSRKPQWLRAVLSELSPIGVFITFSVFSWSYDLRLMVKAIIVSFGVSLVARGFVLDARQQATPEE